MSTSDGNSFFGAPEPDRDGTLGGDVVGERFADPLSGLVTSGDGGFGKAPRPLPTAKPVEHDAEAVKRMVDAALAEETKKKVVKTPNLIPPDDRPDLVPAALLPRQRTWPTKAPQLLKRVPRPRPKQRAAEIAGDDIEEELAGRQSRRGMPSISMPTLGKPSRSTAGVVLALVLLVVFGIVAIELVSSLVSSIAGLFG